jgi:hypothetical protein
MKKISLLLLLLPLVVTAATSEQDIQTLYSRKIDFVIQDALVTANQASQW